MLRLAWRIANSGPVRQGEAQGHRLGFFGAAAFQWINPKAWAIADQRVGRLCGLAGRGGLPLSRYRNAQQRRVGSVRRRDACPFNLTMAVLLVASIVPVLFE
jgi:hypothetical protein